MVQVRLEVVVRISDLLVGAELFRKMKRVDVASVAVDAAFAVSVEAVLKAVVGSVVHDVVGNVVDVGAVVAAGDVVVVVAHLAVVAVVVRVVGVAPLPRSER